MELKLRERSETLAVWTSWLSGEYRIAINQEIVGLQPAKVPKFILSQ